MTTDPPDADLDEILERSEDDLQRLRGSRILVTGSTGFIGSWIAAVLLRADTTMDLGLRVALLVRDVRRLPPSVRGGAGSRSPDVIVCDLTDPIPADAGADLVVHAAAPISAEADSASRRAAHDAIETGMRNLAALFATHAPSRVLLTSSGAVYRSTGTRAIPITEEDELIVADDEAHWYGRAKRGAEEILLASSSESSFDAVIGRLFAFIGPGMDLDVDLAAANFISDAVHGRPITLESQGTGVRSYQYPTDLTVWLLALLTRGRPSQAYNVGSDTPVTIAELARKIAGSVTPTLPCVLGTGTGTGHSRAPEYYVPSTALIEDELRVANLVGIDETVARTIAHFLPSHRPDPPAGGPGTGRVVR